MRTLSLLVLVLFLVAACGSPARRERRKYDVDEGRVTTSVGDSTYVYGGAKPDPAAAPVAAPAGPSAPTPSKPATSGPSTVKPVTPVAPAGPASPASPGSNVPSRGARIDAQILTTRSVPPQYTVAVSATVPTGGYDFGIDHSRFDGDVLTLYLDLKEPAKGTQVTQAIQTLTARYVSGRRAVVKVRVFVNVVRKDGSHSGFELVETAE